MTLMSVYAGNGDVVGRCDACEVTCECVCAGRNHGAGLKAAVDYTKSHASRWIAQYAKNLRLPTHTADVFGESQAQASLF